MIDYAQEAAARTARSPARLLMIEVAERLFAERGIEAVSLREVGHSAGQRNNSAAQYHFGSRDALLNAVIAHRGDPVERRRGELLAGLGDPAEAELAELVRCFVLPLAELVDSGTAAHPTWYLRFLAQLVAIRGGHLAVEVAVRPTHLKALEKALRVRLVHLDRATFTRRMQWLAQISLRILADQEYTREHEAQASPMTPITTDLVGMLVALLEAP